MRRLALATLVFAASAAVFADVAHAAGGTVSPDGRTATDGTRSIAVSAVHDLDPDGEIVTVDGRGYNPQKGIYVAFCQIPPAGQKPSPCGGGDDRDGAAGSSVWISSEIASRAQGSQPFGPNGSFHLRVVLRPVINAETDCRVKKCGVVTRNDHTRGDDQSQDLFVPVTFRATHATTTVPGRVTTTLPPPTLPPTTTTTLLAALSAPVTTVAPDKKTVSGGGKTLTASSVEALAAGTTVNVKGHGFDPARGIYVSLCAIATDGGTPGPCESGSAGTSAWISSNPPDYGKKIAVPYGGGGAFAVAITVTPVIDLDHDCRVIACAITARNDDSHAGDRSQDLVLPVSFEAGPTTTNVTRLAGAPAATRHDQSSTPYEVALGVMVVLFVGGMGVSRLRARSSAS